MRECSHCLGSRPQIVLSVIILLFGIGMRAALEGLGLPVSELANYGTILQLTMLILFFYYIQLIASEILPYDQLIMMQKLSIIGVLVVVRLAMNWGVTDFGVLQYLWLPFLLFNCVGVFFIASAIFKKRNLPT
jgi:hypothetical protein